MTWGTNAIYRRKYSNTTSVLGATSTSSCLARSSSIDSVAECWSDYHYQQLCQQQQLKRSPSPLLGGGGGVRGGGDSRLLSAGTPSHRSSSTRPKGHRALIGQFLFFHLK